MASLVKCDRSGRDLSPTSAYVSEVCGRETNHNTRHTSWTRPFLMSILMADGTISMGYLD